MGTPCYFNSCCPKAVSNITVNAPVNNTTLDLFGGSGGIHLFESKAFTGTDLELPQEPLPGYAMTIYVNGLLQSHGTHYTIDPALPKIISFTSALAGDDVQVQYASAESITPVLPLQMLTYAVVLSGSQITLPQEPGIVFPVVVYVNGVLQALGGDYTIDGAVITFTEVLAGATVQVIYSNN
jgi:hypothetical protein